MRFMKKVLGTFSQFMRPKMKLFPAKFRLEMTKFRLESSLWAVC